MKVAPAQEALAWTPDQVRALGFIASKAVNLNSLRGDKLPTAEAGAALLRGDMTQLVPATTMFLGRALEIGKSGEKAVLSRRCTDLLRSRLLFLRI